MIGAVNSIYTDPTDSVLRSHRGHPSDPL